MNKMPSPATIAASIAGAALAATIAFADIAPYPEAPGFSRKWFNPDSDSTPPAEASPEVQALAKTISEAGMPQLQEALIQVAPTAGDAARAYMQAIYKDRTEKQQTGQITPQETRQLTELQQMVDNGTLSLPAPTPESPVP